MPIGYTVFDINPNTSPYLSCSGCTTVNASHLLFNASYANWKTAVENIIKNAVLTESGAINVDPVAYKDNDTVQIALRAKHQPAGIWYGFRKPEGYLKWYNTISSSEITQNVLNAGVGIQGVNAASAHQLNGPFGDVDVTINQAWTYASTTGDIQFYTWGLSGPIYSAQAVTYSAANNMTGTFYTITVTGSGPDFQSISLYNDADELLSTSTSTTLIYTTATTGDYYAEIMSTNGCVTTINIEV